MVLIVNDKDCVSSPYFQITFIIYYVTYIIIYY